MGFMDGFLKQALGGGQRGAGSGAVGGLVEMVTKNPQILGALGSLLSSRDASVGGSGGLGGLISTFQQKGMGDMISSWIATGPNPGISVSQITDVLGGDTIGQFAAKAGVPAAQAGSVLAGLLPALIDHLTPDGQVPETNALESTLGSLISGLGR